MSELYCDECGGVDEHALRCSYGRGPVDPRYASRAAAQRESAPLDQAAASESGGGAPGVERLTYEPRSAVDVVFDPPELPGAEACARCDRQVLAFLRKQEDEWACSGLHDVAGALWDIIRRIERGEHRKP